MSDDVQNMEEFFSYYLQLLQLVCLTAKLVAIKSKLIVVWYVAYLMILIMCHSNPTFKICSNERDSTEITI
jgi:hypothetical protein